MKHLYEAYHLLSMAFTGWSLTEMKSMGARERNYWIEVVNWRAQKNG